MTDEIQPSRTPNPDQLSRFRDLMGSVREQRSEANAEAGEAREILKGLGFGSKSIAMYKGLTDMSEEIGPAVFEELCQLLDADPAFPYSTGRPNLFADAAVKETKKGKKKAAAPAGEVASASTNPDVGKVPDHHVTNGESKAKLGKGDAKGALKGAIPVEEAIEQAKQHLGTAERDQPTALN